MFDKLPEKFLLSASEIKLSKLLSNSLSNTKESKRYYSNMKENELNITGFYRGLIGDPNAISQKSNTST
jgi:hypothetical protein